MLRSGERSVRAISGTLEKPARGVRNNKKTFQNALTSEVKSLYLCFSKVKQPHIKIHKSKENLAHDAS